MKDPTKPTSEPLRRCVDAPTAAAYLGMSPGVFRRLVAMRRLPSPVDFDGLTRLKLWDLAALDAELDRLSGLAQPSPVVAQQAEAERRARERKNSLRRG